jgi:hypothetical protein
LDRQLRSEIKTADVASAAAREMARADKLAAEANLVLGGSAAEARRQLDKEAHAAEVAAIKLELSGKAAAGAGKSAAGAGGGFTALASPMGAAIAAGVALAPVAVTLAAGLGGLGLAALSASKDTKAMSGILGPLKGELAAFDASLKPEVLQIFGTGAGIAQRALHDLQPVAAATGKALDGVLGQVGAEFRSGQWQQFFAFMARTAGPDMQLLGQNVVDLIRILPQLLTNLQPIATELLQTTDAAVKLIGAADRLGTAAGNLGSSSQHSAGFLDILTGAVKRAVVNIIPGADAAQLFQKGIAAVSGTAPAAATGIRAVAAAATVAAPAVGTLSGDLAILGSTTSNSTVALQAYSDLWNLIVGNSVSDQQAVLNVTQAFESFDKTVKSSGRTSTAAQQAFLSIFTTIGTGLDSLHKNGASVSQLNSFYQTSIDRLNALHNLTPAQRADVQGLTRDYLAWANSVTGLSGNTVKAAGVIRQDFLTALSLTHQLAPTAKADADQLAAAILKTGTNSAATKRDRDVLIADLVRSGLSAAQAKADVLGFQGQVNALHGKTVNVALTTSGSGTIVITGTGINQRTINTSTGVLRGPGGHAAAGMYVTGGVPGKDSVLVSTMPGELIVPTAMVRAGAVDHLRGSIPGFGAGGVVGKVAMAETAIGSADATWAALAATAFAQAAVKAQQTALSGFLGAGSANYAADIATVLSAMGLPLSLTANWLRQIQTESGGNLNAVNLTDSNAQAGHPSVGLLQLIPGTFHAYAGPYVNTPPLVNFGGGTVSENPMAQIYAAIHYAAARYGGAAMAGVIGQGHGYDQGGWLKPGLTLAYNGTGRPEQVIPPGGRGGGTVHVHLENHGVIGSEAQLRNWVGGAVDDLARNGKLYYAINQSPSRAR